MRGTRMKAGCVQLQMHQSLVSPNYPHIRYETGRTIFLSCFAFYNMVDHPQSRLNQLFRSQGSVLASTVRISIARMELSVPSEQLSDLHTAF